MRCSVPGEFSSFTFASRTASIRLSCPPLMKEMLRIKGYRPRIRLFILYVFVFAVSVSLFPASGIPQLGPFAFPGDKPSNVRQAWKRLIGEYGSETSSLLVLEKSGNLILRERDNVETVLQPASAANFTLSNTAGRPISVHFESTGQDHAASIS